MKNRDFTCRFPDSLVIFVPNRFAYVLRHWQSNRELGVTPGQSCFRIPVNFNISLLLVRWGKRKIITIKKMSEYGKCASTV